MYVHFYDISSGIIITTAILVTSQKMAFFLVTSSYTACEIWI